MSKRTATKLSRSIEVIVGYDSIPQYDDKGKRVKNRKEPIKKTIGYYPAQRRTEKDIEYRGTKMKVLVSVGQIINPKKEYKRQRAKLGYSY